MTKICRRANNTNTTLNPNYIIKTYQRNIANTTQSIINLLNCRKVFIVARYLSHKISILII